MGLLDILNGMQNGPRGERQAGTGGMSPLTMALLGLLAYKAIKNFGGAQPGAVPAGPGGAGQQPSGNAVPDQHAGGGFGGLGDLLKGGLGGLAGSLGGLGGGLGGLGGGLGGLLAGGAAGSVLSGGLNDLLKQFDQAGHGEVAKSWVGPGANKQISPEDLEKAIGRDNVNSLAEQAGLSRVELLSGLSQQLPTVIDRLTPEGRVPTSTEMSKIV